MIFTFISGLCVSRCVYIYVLWLYSQNWFMNLGVWCVVTVASIVSEWYCVDTNITIVALYNFKLQSSILYIKVFTVIIHFGKPRLVCGQWCLSIYESESGTPIYYSVKSASKGIWFGFIKIWIKILQSFLASIPSLPLEIGCSGFTWNLVNRHINN